MNGYRKELKFIVGDDILTDVANRISGIMHRDDHQKGDHYIIRSIYFDSPDLVCFRDNEAGVSPREKYRIRSYDCGDDLIHAEIKIRHRDTISKMSTRISRDLLDQLVTGDTAVSSAALQRAIEGNDPAGDAAKRVLEKYLTKTAMLQFRPEVMVCYERNAFVYDICNVRITFDRNVYASTEFNRFFDRSLTGRPVIGNNLHILEIKYDEFLPDEIMEVISGMRLERSSCSKYAKSICPYLSEA